MKNRISQLEISIGILFYEFFKVNFIHVKLRLKLIISPEVCIVHVSEICSSIQKPKVSKLLKIVDCSRSEGTIFESEPELFQFSFYDLLVSI